MAEALAYAQNGAKVKILTPWLPGTPEREKIHPNVEVIRFHYFWPKRMQKLTKVNEPTYKNNSIFGLVQIPFLLFVFLLNILIHSHGVDIIHAQWTLTALLSLPSKWLLNKNIIVTARGSDLRFLPEWLNRLIHRNVAAAIDCFGPQPWNVQYKRKFKANFVRLPLIIHNDSRGLVPQEILDTYAQNAETFIILYIGRFDDFKSNYSKLPLLELVEAAKILKSNGMVFHVFYIGDGHAGPKIIDHITQHNLRDVVTILGPRTNIFDYIEACHLGVGGIALNAVSGEYTIAAKPQILIKVHINENTPWLDMINTIFVEQCNSHDLAAKLEWAMHNRKKINMIGQRAKIDLQEYICDSTEGGRRYLDCFTGILEEKKC